MNACRTSCHICALRTVVIKSRSTITFRDSAHTFYKIFFDHKVNGRSGREKRNDKKKPYISQKNNCGGRMEWTERSAAKKNIANKLISTDLPKKYYFVIKMIKDK